MSRDGADLRWSQDAEQSVLGGAMLAADAIDRLEPPPRPEHFYAEPHGWIWSVMLDLHARRQPIDAITVHDQLQQRGQAEKIGGLAYLNELAQSVPSAANIRMYAAIVRDRALRRKIIETADIVQTIALEPGDAAEKLDQVAALFGAIQRPGARSEPVSLRDLIMERQALWGELETGAVLPGMRTHLPTLDGALGGGLKPGKVIVLAARPSIGKTSLALRILLNVAADGHAALMLSQEMQGGDLADRATASLGGVNLETLTTGRFREGDWTLASDGAEAAPPLLFIDDSPALTLLDIRAKARKLQQRHGLKVLAVDYVQLCAAAAGRQDSRHHQIEQISRGLKQLAKELGICVLLLSQINRQSTQRAEGEPTLADLKESGAIEEDADTVIALHPRGPLPDGSMLVAALLMKNRQGRRGRIALAFNGATQRWVESTADVSRGAA